MLKKSQKMLMVLTYIDHHFGISSKLPTSLLLQTPQSIVLFTGVRFLTCLPLNFDMSKVTKMFIKISDLNFQTHNLAEIEA